MPYPQIGAELRSEIERDGRTDSEIARAAGISQPLLSLIISGKRSLTPSADALTRVLGPKVAQLRVVEYRLELDEQVAAANRRAVALRIEQAISDLSIEAMPEPYGGWEGDPEDVARMERQRIANAEQIAGIRWSVELAPERVAERAGVDTTSPEFDLVKRLCAKWVALLTG
jgi:transcriptional regulator with XRE-family HTH domain